MRVGGPSRIAQQERLGEALAERLGDLLDHGGRDLLEQVTEPGVPQRQLGLRRPAQQH